MDGLRRLVDSHAHLDMCGDPGEEIGLAKEQGVERILAVGFDLGTSRRAVEIAQNHAEVSAAVGIHPHDASIVDDSAMAELAGLASSPDVVAIGETGLDFYRDRSPRAAQKESFLRHIGLAREADLTLVVHSRNASPETLEILEDAGDLRTVLHCFSMYDQLERCIERGFFMSVAGNVTFPKAIELRKAAACIPDHLLLTETDAPWLAPVPHRGETNRPANVRYIVTELARLREVAPSELASRVFSNFQKAFPSPRP